MSATITYTTITTYTGKNGVRQVALCAKHDTRFERQAGVGSPFPKVYIPAHNGWCDFCAGLYGERWAK